MNREKVRCLSPVLLSCVKYQTYQTSREQILYLTNLTFLRPGFRIIWLARQEMLLNFCKAMGTHCRVPTVCPPPPRVLLPIAPQSLGVPSLLCHLTGGAAPRQVKGANAALGETTCRSSASPCAAGLARFPSSRCLCCEQLQAALELSLCVGLANVCAFLVGASSTSP